MTGEDTVNNSAIKGKIQFNPEAKNTERIQGSLSYKLEYRAASSNISVIQEPGGVQGDNRSSHRRKGTNTS